MNQTRLVSSERKKKLCTKKVYTKRKTASRKEKSISEFECSIRWKFIDKTNLFTPF